MTAPPATGRGTASFAYVGSYTTRERNGRGDGIGVYRIDAETGGWTQVQVVRDLVNPSFLTLDHRRRYLYSAHGDGEHATAFAIDAQTGQLKVLSQQPTGGKNGVSLAVDPTDRFLVYASNRGHDSIATFTVDETTGVLTPVAWESSQGKTPRFFALDPSGTFLYAANQGSDTIVSFRIDETSGKLSPTGQVVNTGSPSSIVFA
jgi:6-phosphogluconolactonase (cycloisomerase 2 family)